MYIQNGTDAMGLITLIAPGQIPGTWYAKLCTSAENQLVTPQ